jgi:hypothetical protein
MRTSILVVTLFLPVLQGCTGTPPDPAKVKPVVGSKILVKNMDDVWTDLEAMRLQHKLIWPGPDYKPDDPRLKAIDHLRVGLISPGDMVEILEVGEDFAAVDVLAGGSFCEGRGGNGRLHGYIHQWWK